MNVNKPILIVFTMDWYFNLPEKVVILLFSIVFQVNHFR